MKILIELTQEHYQRLLSVCDRSSAEYRLIQNALVVEDKEGVDSHRVVTFLCEDDEANALLNFAKARCPEAALSIATEIALKRQI